ncbi:MAG: nitroreductase family protein [Verrucomicrobiaceae bacterium]|nr:nitroreductase family protein [Verrucomicrobiaceae bacterium]
MNTLDAIAARRAIKHYDPSHRMTEEEIKTLLTAALQSPTAFNIQHWRFVTVIDSEVRKQEGRPAAGAGLPRARHRPVL